MIRCPLLALALALGLAPAACTATPPRHGDGRVVDLGRTTFPSTASCTAPVTLPRPVCPGESCADNALGPPDGKLVNLAACPTLDLTFTGGTISAPPDAGPGGPWDLRLTVGAVAGRTLVQASLDGQSYTLVAFLVAQPSDLPPLADPKCAAELSGNTALVSLKRCHAAGSTAFLRLTRDRDAPVPGAATVDAVEALSFRPGGR